MGPQGPHGPPEGPMGPQGPMTIIKKTIKSVKKQENHKKIEVPNEALGPCSSIELAERFNFVQKFNSAAFVVSTSS